MELHASERDSSWKNNIDDSGVIKGPLKMWIVDVLNAPKHPSISGVISFRSVYVKKVIVSGVVTDCSKVGTKTWFRVDDSTGSILCSIGHSASDLKAQQLRDVEERLGEFRSSRCTREREVAQAASVVLSFIMKKRPSQDMPKVGDRVIVAGFFTDYFEDVRINAFDLKELSEEMANHHTVMMVDLYNEVYAE